MPDSLIIPRVVSWDELRRTGVRIPHLGLLERLLVYSGSLASIGAYYWAPALLLYVIWKWRKLSKRARIACVGALIFVLATPALMRVRPLRRLARFTGMWSAWLRYFAVHVAFDDDASRQLLQQQPPRASSTPAIVCVAPHGVFPFSLALMLVGAATRTFGLLSPVVADVTVHVPVIGHLIAATAGVRAQAGEMLSALMRGRRLVMSPGGVAEMFCNRGVEEGDDAPDRILLSGRRGLVRVALRAGAPLIPVYVFGASELFFLAPISWLTRPLSRLLRASVIAFVGLYGLPIPRRVPLLYAVGAPIHTSTAQHAAHVAAGIHGECACVDEVHMQLVAAMQYLHDKYQPLYRPAAPPRDLIVM